MIKNIKRSEIKGLNNLVPAEWNFDYESLVRQYFNDPWFHAFIQTHNNRIVGTGNVYINNEIGWLANIMVVSDHRGKGLGQKMTTFLSNFLANKKCTTQLLIATEQGECVYSQAGFKKLTEYKSFISLIDRVYVYDNSIRKLRTKDLESVHKMDHKVNGEDRVQLINKFYKEGFGYFNSNNDLLGFYLPEFGWGLVLAIDKKAGIELLKFKHSKKDRKTLLPIDNQNGVEILEELGLKSGDKSSRMILGSEIKWNPELIYSYGSGLSG